MGAHTKLSDTVPESPSAAGRTGCTRWFVGLAMGLAASTVAWAQPAGLLPPIDRERLGNNANPAQVAPDMPEIASGFRYGRAVRARQVMAITANPLATHAAHRVLENGGTVVDAAVAAQMVLNVVEPQSSGIGGGAFMLHFDSSTQTLRAYDGRETAPAGAWGDYLRYVAPGSTDPVLPNARQSGRSVGVPGVVAMLELAHQRHGSLPWSGLFIPAIELALGGFDVSPRMAASIAASAEPLSRDPASAAYFFTPTGQPLPAGWRLYSPALAQTLARIAAQGSAGFYRGEVARALVDKVADPPGDATPGWMTLTDLDRYRAQERAAVCLPYRDWEVCGFPPPSSGGLAVAQMLGMLEHLDLPAWAPRQANSGAILPDPAAVHALAEAGRLAFADRNHYVADQDFVDLPGGSVAALLAPDYLAERAAQIQEERSLGEVLPGFPWVEQAEDDRQGLPETTHMSMVDLYGNALAMTSSI